MARAYDMSNRARLAAATTERIAAATQELLTFGPLHDVTLQEIATRAGVTVQTVLRHMGSRDGCIEAVRARFLVRLERQRGRTQPGNLTAAVADLIAHYEADGRLVLNLLAQEGSDTFAQKAAAEGRAFHRNWVKRCLCPASATPSRQLLDALVAATDLYVWKLLRLDLRRSRAATEAVMLRTVNAVLESA